MFKKYYEMLLQQLSRDFNCTPEDLQAKENIITVSKLNEGRRIYSPDKPFLQMATMGGNTVIMGMAGCSEDAPGWQQIGIDTLQEYRSKMRIQTCLGGNRSDED